MLIDSHCHPNLEGLAHRLPVVLANMHQAGVRLALAISTNHQTFAEVKYLAESHDCFYASVGTHPVEDKDAPSFGFQELLDISAHPKVVAIGETGLDYHWCEDDLTWQKQRFIEHIEASKATGLPLIIHTRSASHDTLDIMREHDAKRAVIHCFSEDLAFAKVALDLGYYISFSGIVTFKNAKAIQEACRFVPDDRILIETDAPYLAPVPHRGKVNEPAWVRHTASFVAELRGVGLDELIATTGNNFFDLFNKVTRPN